MQGHEVIATKSHGTRGRWTYRQMIGDSDGEYGSDGLCHPGPSGRFEPSRVGWT